MVFQLLASSESQSIEISPPQKIIKMRSSIHFSREATFVFKSSSFLPKVLREKNIRQIDSNAGRSSVKKMGFTQLKWSSSQLTRDHFSRDDHPLVFKLGSETVVKSSCFTIIDYLPKRRRKDLHFNCSKTLRPSKRFFPVRKKVWILILRCLQIRITFSNPLAH